MAKVQKQKLISDVFNEVYEGSPSQDSELSESIVAFWLSNEVNRLVAADIERALSKGDQINPVYVLREPCNQLTEEITPCVPSDDDGSYERYYFQLTKPVINISDDRGILLVTDDENGEINKSSLVLLPMFRNMRFTKPSSQVLSWSRQDELIFIEGFKESDLDFNKIIVYYVPQQDVEALSDTGLVLISDQLLPTLIESVVQKAKLQLYGSQADQENDAKEGVQPVYARQVQNQIAQPQQDNQ